MSWLFRRKARGLRFLLLGLGSFSLPALAIVTQLFTAPVAQAASCADPPIAAGRADWCGYFDNGFSQTGDSVLLGGIPGWVGDGIGDDTQDFLDFINNYRLNGDAWQQTGARFIILTMMGFPGGTPRSQADDPFTFDSWVNNVRAMGPNQIRWHVQVPFPCGTLNTYHQDGFNDDAFFFEAPNSGDGCGPLATVDSIQFGDGAGGGFGNVLYTIKRSCANPIGNPNPIPKSPYNLSADVQPGTDIPSNNIIQPGQTYHLSPVLTNTTNVPTLGSTVEINNHNPAYADNAGTAAGPPVTSAGYQVGGCKQGAPECWSFHYPGFGPNQTNTQPNGVLFSVPAGTPDGTVLCFSATVWQSNANPGSQATGPQHCFTVYRPHYPGIIGSNGDVHAGGTLCGQTTASQHSINLNSNSNSYNEYVLSASGTIAGYGSNNSPGNTAATLGNASGLGNYYSICRPDLVAEATKYFTTTAPPSWTPLAGGSYDLASLPASPSGIYIANGVGSISLHTSAAGFSIAKKITIVALSGTTVTIDGTIKLNTPNVPGSQAPSVGIIAAGDINIKGAATRVDAYLFANGTINTCLEGATAACLNELDVNGFLMANALSFRRLGPGTGPTATVGERITLTGQIYLNPPTFFDDASTINLLQNQGEKPPLN